MYVQIYICTYIDGILGYIHMWGLSKENTKSMATIIPMFTHKLILFYRSSLILLYSPVNLWFYVLNYDQATSAIVLMDWVVWLVLSLEKLLSRVNHRSQLPTWGKAVYTCSRLHPSRKSTRQINPAGICLLASWNLFISLLFYLYQNTGYSANIIYYTSAVCFFAAVRG